MISFDKRYNYYTNSLFTNNEKYIFNIPIKYKIHVQNGPLLIPSNSIQDYCNIYNNNSPYMFVDDDGYDNHDLPCFQKVRLIKNPSKFSILLFNFHFGRHWGPYYDINNKDNIKWENKINEIIWRGAPSGIGDRIKFCEKYYKKYNIGLSYVYENITQYTYLIKPEIKIKKFYEYKYIISIEGNDKDSGLNWKLASNSLVIMPPPTFESWLMEGYLEPYIHYIPLNNDLSNLDEIYNWCLNNDDKCKEIVKNANLFMNNFKNLDYENELRNKVVSDYFNNIKINLI